MISPHQEGTETSLPHKDFVKKLGDLYCTIMIVRSTNSSEWPGVPWLLFKVKQTQLFHKITYFCPVKTGHSFFKAPNFVCLKHRGVKKPLL